MTGQPAANQPRAIASLARVTVVKAPLRNSCRWGVGLAGALRWREPGADAPDNGRTNVNSCLAIEVEELPVRVVTLDGGRTAARLFLHTVSERRRGPETLGERLAAKDARFLPCHVEGGLEMVNLDHVSYLECPADLPELALFDELSSSRTRAVLELSHGERLSGELRYRLPSFGCRLSDLLNAPDEPFLLLVREDRTCCYVNRRAVVRVREEGMPCR